MTEEQWGASFCIPGPQPQPLPSAASCLLPHPHPHFSPCLHAVPVCSLFLTASLEVTSWAYLTPRQVPQRYSE